MLWKIVGNHLKEHMIGINGLQNVKVSVMLNIILFCNFRLSFLLSCRNWLFQCWSEELLYNRGLFEETEGNQPFPLPLGCSNQALHSNTAREKMCNYFHIISSERKIGAAKSVKGKPAPRLIGNSKGARRNSETDNQSNNGNMKGRRRHIWFCKWLQIWREKKGQA